ncbi:MAG: ATP-binding cassette domain-containing protein [Planctomycetes bacterium]|nr:ATP-binding cassette domain-containing protein [Planctomycetota bacterium]
MGAEVGLVHDALEKVGLLSRRTRLFSELSGGQRQRALVARALVRPVDLLLLDEPTAGVDHDAQIEIAELLQQQVGLGAGVLLVTHDPKFWRGMVSNWWNVDEGQVRKLEISP